MKRKLALLAIAVLLLAVIVIASKSHDPLQSKERRAWKQNSIAEISRRAADKIWIHNEIMDLKKRREQNPDTHEGWMSKDLIMMKNGDWLTYSSVCSKEEKHIADLFLAKGSDGKWYYSTYHFCVGMIVLLCDDQPEDLAGFRKAYFLREFDGKSDECLEKTWPPSSN